jgi:DNA polymerase-1
MAKAVNFGILYGMSYFRLANELRIPGKVAKEFIDNYFTVYSQVKEFIERTIAQAHRDGYVSTILQRRRYIPELRDKNHNVRGNAERMAVNTPIQGSAADMIKLAMISCRRRMISEGLKSRMVLQVHDELVFEVPWGEEEAMKSLVKEEMEGVLKLDVPIVADVHTGLNWNEAH